MSKLYDLQDLVEHTGLPERKVRYYLAKVLNAPGGTPGRKAFYSQETLDQLKLARQILLGPYDPRRGEVKPSLRDFRHWLKSQSAEDIRQIANMPYSIKPKSLLAATAPQPAPLRNDEAASDTEDHGQAGHVENWQSFAFGDSLEIRTNKTLTPDIEKQLDLAGRLLQSLLQLNSPA